MVGAALAMAYDASYYQIFALAGMGACISAVVGAPFATILIVFELNQSYSVATAVMVAVVISNLLPTNISLDPIPVSSSGRRIRHQRGPRSAHPPAPPNSRSDGNRFKPLPPMPI